MATTTDLLLAGFLAATLAAATDARAQETPRQECRRDLVHCIKSLNSAIAMRAALPRGRLRQAVGEHDRINSAGARCADAFEAELFLLEQTIKHAPGERATTTATPQRQVHNFGHLGRSQRPHTCCGAFEDSSIVSAVRLLTATLYPVDIRPLLETQVCRYPQFFRTCCRGCNDTCQAPFRPVAFDLDPYCWPLNTPVNCDHR